MSKNESCHGNGVRGVRQGIDCVHLILPRHENLSGILWDEQEQVIIVQSAWLPHRPFANIGSYLKVESTSFVQLYRKKHVIYKSPNPAALHTYLSRIRKRWNVYVINITVTRKCQPVLGKIFAQGAQRNTTLYDTRSAVLSTETGTTSGEARGERIHHHCLLSSLLLILFLGNWRPEIHPLLLIYAQPRSQHGWMPL